MSGLPLPAAGESHVWVARLGALREALPALGNLLSEEERARQSRLLREPDRAMFALSIAMRRLLLGRYLDVSPEAVAFETGHEGKPSLRQSTADRLHFNVTHSGDVAIVAVARVELGVDIEEVRPLDDLAALVRSLSPIERRAFDQLPHEMHLAVFFACWSRKEALAKATGLGLTLPLDSFDVIDDAASVACTLRAVRDPRIASVQWAIQDLPILNGYAAAIATRAPGVSVRLLEWRGPS